MRSFFTNLLEPISYLITTIILIFCLKYFNSIKIWVLFIFNLLATLLMSFASLKVLPQLNNIIEYDLLLLSASSFVTIYFYLIFDTKFNKIFCLIIIVLGLLNFIQRDLVFHKYSHFDSLGFYTFSLFIIILIFFYFNQMLRKVSNESILINLDFWINISFLIYHLGSIIIFLSIYTLTMLVNEWKDHLNVGNLWAGQNILLFLSAVCLMSGAIWISFHKKSFL